MTRLTESLDRVAQLLSTNWPEEPDLLGDWAAILGIPDAAVMHAEQRQSGSAMAEIWCRDEKPVGVHWFVLFPAADELAQAHATLVTGLSELIGGPSDTTATTAAWNARGLCIEAYAYFPDSRSPNAIQQTGVQQQHEVSLDLIDRH